MFRIRRIYDTSSPINKREVEQTQQILREQFSAVRPGDIEKLPDMLTNPLKYRFRAILFIADSIGGNVHGFALLLHAPDLDFCYLDYISTAKNFSSRGIGGALYERVRIEAAVLNSKGLFFECLPDDPQLCKDPEILKQNIARLRFYEKYGARPIINTKYETPVNTGDDCPPYIVADTLGTDNELKRDDVRRIIKAILERKYPDLCNKDYNNMVINSISDDPVKLRPFRYRVQIKAEVPKTSVSGDKLISLVYNEGHNIHHVNERGYVEAPIRIDAILSSLNKTHLFKKTRARHFGDHHITAVHDNGYISYLKKVCSHLSEKESVYPYVFPIRNNSRPPKELPMRAGYYCIDTFTPLNKNAYAAARSAVNCALTAAQSLLEGANIAYALIRPPGHHAERKVFGGFCYMNSAAIAANYLSRHGKVVILDIDFHHGNGQQDIFYERDDVYTISIHGHPRFAYPFFSGFDEEIGEGKGKGFNLNIPLPEHIAVDRYIEAIEKSIQEVRKYNPGFLIVALGFDTAKGDPTGTWGLAANDFMRIGEMIGRLSLSKLFVQEGGYKTKTIGKNAEYFFRGVWRGTYERE